MPATATVKADENNETSKHNEENQESEMISSKDLSSDDCQSVTKIVTTQNEFNARGSTENGALQLS